MRQENGYWIDENNNRWDATLYAEYEAIKWSKALINCKGCVNCKGCSGCTDCKGCVNCEDCSGCTRCWGCTNCKDCEGCVNCEGCSGGYTDCCNCISCTDKMICANCRIEIEESYYKCLDNFIQVQYFEEQDQSDNIFCSKECFCDALSLEEIYIVDESLDAKLIKKEVNNHES